MKSEKKKIIKPKLMLVEGKDDSGFFNYALNHYGLDDVQTMEFDGKDNFRGFILELVKRYGFEDILTLVVCRDADTDKSPTDAFLSVSDSLKAAGLPQPAEPFVFTSELPKVAIIIMPGYDTTSSTPTLRPGALEDLCLEIVKEKSVLECVDNFLECVRTRHHSPEREHKSKLHAYLSMVEEHAGDKLGEASSKGAFDYDHPAMQDFKKIIKSM
ncbi:MAG: hypothetical protein HQK58_08100 [Deltaproteobacteria bacterium]|nr:hypothetical protein [Deltaproteobacteria bacterium]